VAWGPVKGRFARAVTDRCAVWLSYCCLVLCAEQILEGEGERERADVRTNGYWICGVFPHPHHLNANHKDERNNANCIKIFTLRV